MAANVTVLAPPVARKVTVAPPVLRLFPAASLPCRVATTVWPELTVPAESVVKEVAVEMAPGLTSIDAVLVTGEPPIVALIVVVVPES